MYEDIPLIRTLMTVLSVSGLKRFVYVPLAVPACGVKVAKSLRCLCSDSPVPLPEVGRGDEERDGDVKE